MAKNSTARFNLANGAWNTFQAKIVNFMLAPEERIIGEMWSVGRYYLRISILLISMWLPIRPWDAMLRKFADFKLLLPVKVVGGL